MIVLCDMIDSPEGGSKFSQIYKLYRNTIYSVAFDIIKNEHDAEDVLEETLIKVIGILDDIDEEMIGTAKCKNLMITIAKHKAIDYWRKMKHLPIPMEVMEKQTSGCKDAEELCIEVEDYQELIQCINGLDERYRDVLNLKVLHHLSSKQIADLLDTTEANVNMRFMRAKRMLAKRLEALKAK